MIQFKNLTCKLGGREILKNVSGEILPEKVTAVLGPNGCGKSTFLRALLGLVPVQPDGVVLGLKKAGYLPQKKEIYWPLTCEAIVNLQAGGQRPEAGINALKRMRLEYLRDKRIDEVSGGERTLVLLARALLSAPEIIVADEPVSELDPQYQIQVMRILREEATRGAVVLITMHDIQLTARFCDSVFLMKEGCLVKKGAPPEVLQTEILSGVFNIPFKSKAGFYAE